MTDRRGKLEEQPFSYRETKDGRVMIYWQGRLIKTLAGGPAIKFSKAAAGKSESEIQLLLAKATGHFKHGNER
ncbi:MAG: hypothetical protein KC729_14360 [Candidatus Eisenbacteria bacterium]|uniref:Uncharacterized protein n=1 Tax=Eiseniibacteriota bacterium TaxID=2212470 RepID=A0A956M2R7_UNCEI|nr:hypothetical protein [Candidatus Eisenbacteria bacterium]